MDSFDNNNNNNNNNDNIESIKSKLEEYLQNKLIQDENNQKQRIESMNKKGKKCINLNKIIYFSVNK